MKKIKLQLEYQDLISLLNFYDEVLRSKDEIVCADVDSIR